MYNPATPFLSAAAGHQPDANNLPTGHLLINEADEIIYANKQARHFLGLLTDESLPIEQTFLSLVQAAYQCLPLFAWLGWPKRPSSTTSRYLIFSSANSSAYSSLKVEVVEQLVVNNKDIWVVAINLVEPPPETLFSRPTVC